MKVGGVMALAIFCAFSFVVMVITGVNLWPQYVYVTVFSAGLFVGSGMALLFELAGND